MGRRDALDGQATGVACAVRGKRWPPDTLPKLLFAGEQVPLTFLPVSASSAVVLSSRQCVKVGSRHTADAITLATLFDLADQVTKPLLN
jgi:hypothetical protein